MSLIDLGSGRAGRSVISINSIRWAAVLCSLILTFIVVSQDHMPNDDGVLYLLSAEQFAEGEWSKALQLYDWPLYGTLIASVHVLSGMGIETSAYALNGLLQAVLVFVFLGVVSALGGDRKTVLAASVLILIFPNLNEYRSEIIRGHGYWAFAMLGLFFLLKYVRQCEAGYLVACVAALALAGLFRIEGLVLMALVPLAFLLDPRNAVALRVKRLTWVYSVYLFVAGFVLAALYFGEVGGDSLRLWDKPADMLIRFYSALSSDLSHKVAILQKDFLIPYSDEYAWSIVAASIIIILFTEIAVSVGFVVGFLAVYAWLRTNVIGDIYQRRIVYFFMASNLLMLAAFVLSLGFLTGRYPIALTLLVMLFAPFGLVALYRQLTGSVGDGLRQRRWINAVFVIAALALFVDGIYSFSPGKVHIKQAAAWLNEHTSPADRILSLDAPLLYRSGTLRWERYLEYRQQWQGVHSVRDAKELTLGDILKTTDWRQFDYIAALVSRKAPDQQAHIEGIISSSPIKEFYNRKGDRVLIYTTEAKAVNEVGIGS